MNETPAPEAAAVTPPTLSSAAGLFKRALALWRERFWILFGIAAVPVAIGAIGLLLLVVLPGVTKVLGVLMLIVGFVLGFVSPISLIISIRDKTGIMDSLQAGVRRFFPYLWISILSTLIILGGVVMLIVPAIIFGVWFTFATYAFVMEDRRGMHALMASRDYVRGRFWKVVGRLLLMGLALLVVGLIVYGILWLVLGEVSEQATNFVLQVLFMPFVTSYLYLLYEELRAVQGVVEEAPKGRKLFVTSAILGLIASILILAGIILIAVSGVKSIGQDAKKVADLYRMRVSLEQYREQCGFYPGGPNCAEGGTQGWDELTAALRESGIEVPDVDSDTAAQFGYDYAHTSTTYTLAVQLEDEESLLLQDDVDENPISGSFGCEDPMYCVTSEEDIESF